MGGQGQVNETSPTIETPERSSRDSLRERPTHIHRATTLSNDGETDGHSYGWTHDGLTWRTFPISKNSRAVSATTARRQATVAEVAARCISSRADARRKRRRWRSALIRAKPWRAAQSHWSATMRARCLRWRRRPWATWSSIALRRLRENGKYRGGGGEEHVRGRVKREHQSTA